METAYTPFGYRTQGDTVTVKLRLNFKGFFEAKVAECNLYQLTYFRTKSNKIICEGVFQKNSHALAEFTARVDRAKTIEEQP